MDSYDIEFNHFIIFSCCHFVIALFSVSTSLSYFHNKLIHNLLLMLLFSGKVMSNSLWPYGLACQAPLSFGFSRQEFCSGLPCLRQGIFPMRGSNLPFLRLLYRQAGCLPLVPPGKTCVSSIFVNFELGYSRYLLSSLLK